jgi:hypothetical protein
MKEKERGKGKCEKLSTHQKMGMKIKCLMEYRLEKISLIYEPTFRSKNGHTTEIANCL